MRLGGVPDTLAQTEARESIRVRCFAAFSPRKKVPAGRMRGKEIGQTKVHQSSMLAAFLLFIHFSCVYQRGGGCTQVPPLRLSVVFARLIFEFAKIRAIRVKAFVFYPCPSVSIRG